MFRFSMLTAAMLLAAGAAQADYYIGRSAAECPAATAGYKAYVVTTNREQATAIFFSNEATFPRRKVDTEWFTTINPDDDPMTVLQAAMITQAPVTVGREEPLTIGAWFMVEWGGAVSCWGTAGMMPGNASQ